jgi:tetratricopeptide (TPR) repeat protein
VQVLKYPSVPGSRTESEFERRVEQLSFLAKALATEIETLQAELSRQRRQPKQIDFENGDKGVVALAEGGKDKTTVAARCFEKAVSIYPQFVEARLRLGTAYMDLGEWDKAEQALLATLEVDGRAFNALFALSEIYLQENKIADAEKVLVQGLAIQEQSYLGHLNLARVYWEKAREIKDLVQAKPVLEKCYEEVKRALALNPALAGAHLLKGNLLLRVSRKSDALVEFNEYLRLEPNGSFANETRTLVDKISRTQKAQMH